MIDARIERLAKILVNYSVNVQPGDKVLLTGSIAALPLVSEILPPGNSCRRSCYGPIRR